MDFTYNIIIDEAYWIKNQVKSNYKLTSERKT